MKPITDTDSAAVCRHLDDDDACPICDEDWLDRDFLLRDADLADA